MFFKILTAFILIPLADLVLLWILFYHLPWYYSIALIVGSGFLGAYLAKMQGRKVLMDIRKDLQDNLVPASTLIHGAIIMFAGGLLITPGLITDLMGFSLLFPFTREFIRKRLVQYLRGKFHVQTAGFQTSFHPFGNDGSTVDGEVNQSKSNPEDESWKEIPPEKISAPKTES